MTDTTIYQRLVSHAAIRGQKTALVHEDRTLSYAEVLARVAQYRVRLPGDARRDIALLLGNDPELLLLFIAAISLGHNVQVLDPEWPSAMLAATLQRLRPWQVIAHPDGLDHPALIDPEALLRVLPDTDRAPLATDPDWPFYTGFTSGSSGEPKGFVRSEGSWLASFAADRAALDFAENDVFVIPGNFAHSLFLYAALRSLYAGATGLIFPGFRPDRVVAATRRWQGSVLYAVPTQIHALVNAAGDRPLDSLRLVLSSGAKFPRHWHAAVGAAFPKSALHEFYGTSELSYIALGRVDPQQPASRVGRPLPGVAVAILDAERQPLATGAIGEIFVRSPFMFLGYAAPGGQPSLTGCTLHGDYLSVGDTGFLDREGALHLVGRADRMLLVAGRNIHPEAVETVLLGAPGVRRVAVLGEPDERRGQRLVAILGSVERMDPAALRAYCRQHLPAHSIPQRFYAIADWPLTASHKTDYPALRARLLAGELSGP